MKRTEQLASRGERREALLGERVAVDRDERARGAEPLGEQARVPAVAERAVDRRLAGLRVEQLEQLARRAPACATRPRSAPRARPAPRPRARLRASAAAARAAAARELGARRPPARALHLKQRRRHAR